MPIEKDTKYSGKNLSQYHSVPQKCHTQSPGIATRSLWPATNTLSHGTAPRPYHKTVRITVVLHRANIYHRLITEHHYSQQYDSTVKSWCFTDSGLLGYYAESSGKQSLTPGKY